jgi:predicted nucleic acid-binding protein
MIVLDTNVISELRRPETNPAVERWFRGVDFETVYLCAPVLMEQSYGAEYFLLKSGSAKYVERLDRIIAEFGARILAFDLDASKLAGMLRAARASAGRPISVGDAMIAAICIAHGATLATRNVRDFVELDLKLVNPFEAEA